MERLRIIHLMKIIFVILFSTTMLDGQVVIDNPEKPKNKLAGRLIQLEEVMRIRDDGKNFVFRNPTQISELQDGSILFFDYPFFIRVSKQGQFLLKSLIRARAGESQHPDSYIIEEDRIRVYSWIPRKFWNMT